MCFVYLKPTFDRAVCAHGCVCSHLLVHDCIRYTNSSCKMNTLTHMADYIRWYKSKKEDRRFGPFSDLPMWHSAMVSSSANSLFADENTRESLVGFIKACDYIYSRVLNVCFCTGHMRQPFYSRAIPTYGVLPYSMI